MEDDLALERLHSWDWLNPPSLSDPLWAAMSAGLQRSLGVLLGLSSAHFVVVEATAPEGGPLSLAGCLKNRDACEFSPPLVNLSPVPHSTWLFPTTRGNRIEVSSRRDRVILDFPLAAPHDDPRAELDIYCAPDPKSGGGELEAFATLRAGQWALPTRWSDGSSWPRSGTRPPFVDEESQPQLALTAADLLANLRLPFAGRFARLPPGTTQALAAEGKRMVVEVTVGSAFAQELAQTLTGKLRINHGLFWNRRILVNDRVSQDPRGFVLDAPMSDERPLVLDVRPLYGSRHSASCATQLYDTRFQQHLDPMQSFSLERLDASRWVIHTRLESADYQLKVEYLVKAPWPAGINRMTSMQARQGACVLTGKDISHTSLAEATDERLHVSWLCSGIGSAPHARAVSRRDIARLVNTLAPKPLSDAITRTEIVPAITAAKHIRGQPGSSRAYPGVVVRLLCNAATDKTSLLPFIAWLEHAMNERIIANINATVELTDDDGVTDAARSS